MGMRKLLAHDIRMQKNPQTKEDTSWILRIFMELCGSKVQLAPLHESFFEKWMLWVVSFWVLMRFYQFEFHLY